MGKITFISGGARSGKSRFALELAKTRGRKIAFIATAQALDTEMQRRIALHKKSRPGEWQTYEEPLNLLPLVKKIGIRFEVIIIDCLTLLVSNLLLAKTPPKQIENKISMICSALKKAKAEAIIISNEVGMGIVPDNMLSREFRDIAGRVNQLVAQNANEAVLLFSGLPLKVK